MSVRTKSRYFHTSSRAILATAAAVVLFAAVAIVSPANAEAASASAVRSTSVSPTPDDGTGQNLHIQARSATVPAGPFNFVESQTPGVMRLVDPSSGECVSHFVFFVGVPALGGQDCWDYPSGRWIIVPVSQNPTAAANSDPDGHYFYLVSPSNAAQGDTAFGTGGGYCMTASGTTYVMAGCTAGNPAQEMHVIPADDQPNPNGVSREWKAILQHAVDYATNLCTIDQAGCTVTPSTGAQAGQTFAYGDPDVLNNGTIGIVNTGCGTALNASTPIYNSTANAIQETVSGSQSVSNSTAVSNSVSRSVSVSIAGKGINANGNFSYNNTTVNTNSAGNTSTSSLQIAVQPYSYLMGVWEQNTYSLPATWTMGISTPAAVPGSLAWNIQATGVYPVASPGAQPLTYTAVTSHDLKNCDAVPAAVNAGSPVPAASLATCGDATPTPASGYIGTTAWACPGTWTEPAGVTQGTPAYHYQWYLTEGGIDTPHPIVGATNQSFPITASTLGDGSKTLFLGVIVTNAGNIDTLGAPSLQLESTPAVSQVTSEVRDSLGNVESTITEFSAGLPPASTDTPYTTTVIAHPGKWMKLSYTTLPAGLALSADGTLSGTPTVAGSYPITFTDTPTNGHPVVTTTLILNVRRPFVAYLNPASFSGTVGTTINTPTATSTPEGVNLGVTDGDMPPGTLLSASGVVTGTPTQSGTYTFTVGDLTTLTDQKTITVAISDTPTVFISGALPNGQVGVAYGEDTVQTIGSNSLITRTADSPTDLNGLSLNALTGKITGTPTTAGTTTLTVTDANDPSSTQLVVAITITAAASAAPTSVSTTTPGSASGPTTGQSARQLANTGQSVGTPLALTLLLSALGIGGIFLARARRRRS